MSFNGDNTWLNGVLALSVIGYGLFSAFISGPELLSRTAIKENWPQQCTKIVQAELRASQPEPEFTPQIDYRSIARGWLGRDAEPLLQLMEPLGQVMDQANAQAQRIKRKNEERLRQKAKAAGSACNCAISMLGEKRIALGLFAGTGRLVTPPMFQNLNAELKTALHFPQCSISFKE